MNQLDTFLALSTKDLYQLAEANVKAWSKESQAMCRPTIDNMFAGVLAELTVAKSLRDDVGCTDIECNGVVDFLNTAATGEPQRGRNPDITCKSPNGKALRIEVKSGRPERFPHRQFIAHQIAKYKKDSIDLVTWVDVFSNDTAEVYNSFTIEAIESLPLKNNFRGKPCHTATGGY